MNYSIDEFWKKQLGGITRTAAVPSLTGWASSLPPNQWFVEPELHFRPNFDDLSVPIWLVAAPGAVGKSTLAREISAQTGAAYLDLAKADTVAGNYLTGGLVKNSLLSLWQQNQAAVLIDALDEARLRVTQGSFEDFLRDVKGLSDGRSLPQSSLGALGSSKKLGYYCRSKASTAQSSTSIFSILNVPSSSSLQRCGGSQQRTDTATCREISHRTNQCIRMCLPGLWHSWRK